MAFEFFKQLIGKNVKPQKIQVSVTNNLIAEIYIRELAYNICKTKITNALSKCTINIYEKNIKKKNDEWYRWNIQPNINQNSNQFFSKLIDKLYDENECLVIVNNNELFVVDSYYYNDTSALFEHYFENVTISNFTFNRRFYMSEVFYFKLNEQNTKNFLDGTLSLYSKLIQSAYNNYLVSNGSKGFIKVSQFNEQRDDFETEFQKMINEDFKSFLSSQNAVMPLFEGYEYEELKNNGTVKDTRDFKNLLSDVIELSADALNVPASLALGNVQDTSKAIDELLTFCIDPLVKILEKEMNRKLFTKQQILNGTHISFDTKAIKHIDLLDVATSIDKLISSGFTCINDLREICEMDRIDEDWANQFFMTKNYSTIEDLMKELKGGGENEK